MPNFPSGGAARGLRAGLEIRESRKNRESDEQQKRTESFKKANDEARELAIGNASQFSELAAQAAAKGATPEQLEEFRKGATSVLMSYGQTLELYRQQAQEVGEDPSSIPFGRDFVEDQMALFDARVSEASIEDTSDDFETVSVEELAELERVSGAKLPEGALIQRSSDGEISLAFDPTENPSTIEERRRLLLESGLDRPMGELSAEEIANGIAGGRFSFGVNPITKEMFIKDLTGQEIARESIDLTPKEEVPVIPTGITTGSATGAKGIVINVANTLRDAFGMGLQDPEAQDATDALTTIQTLTSLHLLQEISGRDTDGLRKRLDRLTVSPNSIFQGKERARNRLEDTQQVLQGEIDRMENQLKTEIDPKTRIKLQNNIPQIKRLRDAYDGLVKGFDAEEEEVDEELEDLLNKHAPEEDE